MACSKSSETILVYIEDKVNKILHKNLKTFQCELPQKMGFIPGAPEG